MRKKRHTDHPRDISGAHFPLHTMSSHCTSSSSRVVRVVKVGGNTLRLAFGAREGVVVALELATAIIYMTKLKR